MRFAVLACLLSAMIESMNPSARARIRTRRELVRQGYGPLYERIHQILVRHNPIGSDVSSGDARDDYGLPVGTLIPRLGTIKDCDLKDALFFEMHHWYGEQAGTPEHYEVIARDVWQAWTEFQRGSN